MSDRNILNSRDRYSFHGANILNASGDSVYIVRIKLIKVLDPITFSYIT